MQLKSILDKEVFMNFLNKDDNNIIICKPNVKDYLLKKLEQENEFF